MSFIARIASALQRIMPLEGENVRIEQEAGGRRIHAVLPHPETPLPMPPSMVAPPLFFAPLSWEYEAATSSWRFYDVAGVTTQSNTLRIPTAGFVADDFFWVAAITTFWQINGSGGGDYAGRTGYRRLVTHVAGSTSPENAAWNTVLAGSYASTPFIQGRYYSNRNANEPVSILATQLESSTLLPMGGFVVQSDLQSLNPVWPLYRDFVQRDMLLSRVPLNFGYVDATQTTWFRVPSGECERLEIATHPVRTLDDTALTWPADTAGAVALRANGTDVFLVEYSQPTDERVLLVSSSDNGLPAVVVPFKSYSPLSYEGFSGTRVIAAETWTFEDGILKSIA